MAKNRKDVQAWMRKQLGKETADAMLKKLDNMANKPAPISAIEKMIAEDLSKHCRKVRNYVDHAIFIFVPQKGSK